MNRLIECVPYRIREELEEVLEPWPIGSFLPRTFSDLEVTIQGKHLPRTAPRAHSVENEEVKWKYSPLKAKYLLEHQHLLDVEGSRKDEAIDEGMRVLDDRVVLPPYNLFDDILEHDEEPDDTWAMLESENEARYRFEAFLKRMRIHFADYVKTEDNKAVERPKYELSPLRRAPKERTSYYDKRCEDKRKMIPFVYAAPPYPEYWLLKKKFKPFEEQPAGEEQEDQA